MARAGLGPAWRCLFANDFDPRKGAAYRRAWGGEELRVGDVAALAPADLLGAADLAWASFPCQDLSLAGLGAGLQGERSGAFWPFWRLIEGLRAEGRAPRLVVLENVVGALTSHGGGDFRALCEAMAAADYRFGALVVDALDFTPQSRPRLFVIATAGAPPPGLTAAAPSPRWHPRALLEAQMGLSLAAKRGWLWWRLPEPPKRNTALIDLLEENPPDAPWRPDAQTRRLLSLMAEPHRRKLEAALAAPERQVGALFRRTRTEAGAKAQRAEVRFDGVAGCLRTPAGGSSRQTLLLVERGEVRSRHLSAREAARLMGLPDAYPLPARATEAHHLVGDGVVVPVVRFLAEHLLEPLLAAREPAPKARRA